MTKREKKSKELDEFSWSFDMSLAEFILPRLRRLKKRYLEWTEPKDGLDRKVFNKMIYSFTKLAKGEHIWSGAKSDKKIQEGLDLFAKYYMSLWW